MHMFYTVWKSCRWPTKSHTNMLTSRQQCGHHILKKQLEEGCGDSSAGCSPILCRFSVIKPSWRVLRPSTASMLSHLCDGCDSNYTSTSVIISGCRCKDLTKLKTSVDSSVQLRSIGACMSSGNNVVQADTLSSNSTGFPVVVRKGLLDIMLLQASSTCHCMWSFT